MNLKNILGSFLIATLSVVAFAHPASQMDDGETVAAVLQQFPISSQTMQKVFDEQLLPPLKGTAELALQMYHNNQTEMSAQQKELYRKYGKQVDDVMTNLVTIAFKDFDLARFNQFYNEQIARPKGMPSQELTIQQVIDIFRAACFVKALFHFGQTQKLNEEELAVLTNILFQNPQ